MPKVLRKIGLFAALVAILVFANPRGASAVLYNPPEMCGGRCWEAMFTCVSFAGVGAWEERWDGYYAQDFYTPTGELYAQCYEDVYYWECHAGPWPWQNSWGWCGDY